MAGFGDLVSLWFCRRVQERSARALAEQQAINLKPQLQVVPGTQVQVPGTAVATSYVYQLPGVPTTRVPTTKLHGQSRARSNYYSFDFDSSEVGQAVNVKHQSVLEAIFCILACREMTAQHILHSTSSVRSGHKAHGESADAKVESAHWEHVLQRVLLLALRNTYYDPYTDMH